MKIFISSVQKEFAAERKALAAYLAGDPLLRRFFESFLFERDIPASDRRPDAVYLDEVRNCDLYIGLFGDDYGWENSKGFSPTHLEYKEATRLGKTRLIFVKGSTDEGKHPKMQALIREVGTQLVRRRFRKTADLLPDVYASLVDHLEATGNLTRAPWDARAARKATLDDLDSENVARFVRRARKARNFPLPVEAEMTEVLTHLNLLDDGKPTNAAILLFGKYPQRFCLPSEVKCAHFHGTEVAKPIPSYQVYKGTAFELVDQAIDFVMSKINARVGTRELGPQAPVTYEIPRDVVAEAIVNAVAHRDYNSNGSVQVMLFTDRLEVWNPGTLPKALTLADLRRPHSSIPGNPLLAEPLYLTKYIERMGTGTRDMIRKCLAAGLPEPEFTLTDSFVTTIRKPVAAGKTPRQDHATGQVTGQVAGQVTGQVEEWILKALEACADPQKSTTIQKILGIQHRETFQRNYLDRLLNESLVERTIPDKPTSRLQKYRLTNKGKALIAQRQKKEDRA
jgi:predicted HTH transcriptional regulator